jgi:hypothetical protein
MNLEDFRAAVAQAASPEELHQAIASSESAEVPGKT